jgi:hypothetical protein
MVNGSRQLLEESSELFGICGIEGRGAPGIDLHGGVLEAAGIPADEDDVSSLTADRSRRLESDAGTAAEQDDGLTE